MTKFLLHGGYTSKKSISNDNYFKEIIRGLKPPIKILNIYFATNSKKEWRKLFKDDQEKFQKAGAGKKLTFIIADEKTSVLEKQIKNSDVLYIRGGRDNRALIRIFGKIKDLKNIIKGKIVAGSSAGAYVLSEYYYSRTRGKVEKGLGVLPIKTIAHYDAQRSKEHIRKLAAVKKNLKIYKIPEIEYRIIKAD